MAKKPTDRPIKTVEQLTQELISAQTGTPEACAETAIGAYVDAGLHIKALEKIKEAAKALVLSIMEETEMKQYKTPNGRAVRTEEGLRVSYDTKALDALILSQPHLQALLEPHRKETSIAPGVRIEL